MKPRVYVETTVVSYLTAKPSGDIVVAGCQQITREWWLDAAGRFELVGSEYLVTWNCRHIANATARSQIEQVCRNAGYEPTIICTPAELMNPDNSDDEKSDP